MLDLLWGRGEQSRATRSSTLYLFNCFTIMGINSGETWKPFYYLYAAIVLLSVDVYLIMAFYLRFFLLFGQMSTSQFLTSLQVAMNACGLPAKVSTVKWNMQRLREAEDIMDVLDQACQHEREYKKIRHCVKICSRIALLYGGTYILYSVFSFLPSVLMGKPPYSLYMHPLDWRQSSWEFMLQSFIEFMLMNFACLQQSMSDGYALIYVYILRTHMQILVERVRRLGSVEAKTKEQNHQELIDCIKDHQNLMRMHSRISPCISVTIFVQFILTAAIVGTTMINLLIFADTTAQIGSVVYFMAVLLQTSPCCYQASCLLDDSDQLPLAILQCRWWEEDKRFRKMLVFFMQCAQKPLALSAMKIFPITINTNLSIAKFSFSLYTLIKNMDFGKNMKN